MLANTQLALAVGNFQIICATRYCPQRLATLPKISVNGSLIHINHIHARYGQVTLMRVRVHQ